MPRYFFNVHNVQPSADDLGEELPDDEAAWTEATRYAGDVFKDIDGKFRPGQQWALEVTDATRRPIYHIRITSRNRK
jgi:Domain of unknown function (DUF6894)